MGLRILFGFLSLILCVALFATSVLAIVLADVRVLTNEENLKVIVSHVMFGTPIQKNSSVAPQAVGGMKLEDPTSGMPDAQQMVINALYDMLSKQFGEEVPFTQKEVEELLNRSTLPDFLAEKIAGIMSDIYTGKVTTTISGEEVAQLLRDNMGLIEETFGFALTEEHINNIVQQINAMDVTSMIQNILSGKPPVNSDASEEGGMMGGDSFTSGTGSAMETFSGGVLNGLLTGKGTVQDIVNGGLPVILMAVREVTSVEALMVVLATCVILIGLLFVVNMKQLRVAVRCVGVTSVLAGLPFAAATVVAFAVPSLFAGTVLSIVYLGLTLTAGVSIGVFGVGLVLVVVSMVMTAVYKKNLKTPEAAPVEAASAAPEMPVLNPVPVEEEAPVVEEMPVMEEVAPVELPVEEVTSVTEEPQQV